MIHRVLLWAFAEHRSAAGDILPRRKDGGLMQDTAKQVQALLYGGQFGLEKESLRITGDGFFSHTQHPFPDNDHIVRDFCENQTEINTPVSDSAEEAVAYLLQYTREIQQKLLELPRPELLWPFSNPPYIRNERDIPIAQFFGAAQRKTLYRQHLAEIYGRYKMTLSGIHVNYSFSQELLRQAFLQSGETEFSVYKNRFYLSLAQRVVEHGWLLVALTAASPVTDSSFIEKGKWGTDCFGGMASVRCSELGYWNSFTPVLDYGNIQAYADSIQLYVDQGWIDAPSELYYPVRLKPRGENTLDALRQKGVNHIELRMFDLNPLTDSGVDLRDVEFVRLFLVWLVSLPQIPLSSRDQVCAMQNFKNAARYDLKAVNIMRPDGSVIPVADAALELLEQIRKFYREAAPELQEILAFEQQKFLDPETRYAWQIRKRFANSFVEKGLRYASAQQKRIIEK